MAGTNATQTISDLEEVLGKASETLPSGLKINIAQSANDFLFASIHEVIKTLIEAFILVFIVVYIFLQDMRSTLIPAIAIPVALIATFFVLQLIGFSINLLTLSAMVLAIAIVVDDAIVVVPVVSRVRIPLSLFIWDLSSAGRASALQAEGHRFEPYRSHYGWIPEWPKGTDCKSAANCFGGSNPPPSI